MKRALAAGSVVLVDDEGAVLEAAAVLDVLQIVRAGRAARLEVADVVGADGALRGPLGVDGPVGRVGLDVEIVVDVDRGAVRGPGPAVAAVVGPDHPGAGLVMVGERDPGVGHPRLVTELHALADGGAAAAERERGRARAPRAAAGYAGAVVPGPGHRDGEDRSACGAAAQ